jgi:hypothetical protein
MPPRYYLYYRVLPYDKVEINCRNWDVKLSQIHIQLINKMSVSFKILRATFDLLSYDAVQATTRDLPIIRR